MLYSIDMKPQYQLHPWHGIEQPKNCPEKIHVFVEFVPTDVMKYEIDKHSGHLKIDRPQRFSNQCPAPYGFLPQTYCGQNIAQIACAAKGDGDPLDVCVLTERPIQNGGILLTAIPIGGLRMIDKEEADDKIIAVLDDDPLYGSIRNLSEVPEKVIARLKHYFLTYKLNPGETSSAVKIDAVYAKDEAIKVISASREDYKNLD